MSRKKFTITCHTLNDISPYTPSENIGTFYSPDGIRHELFYQFDQTRSLHCIVIWKYGGFNVVKSNTRYYDGAIKKETAISATIEALSLTQRKESKK